jgi:large subunit ribosomal protein L4
MATAKRFNANGEGHSEVRLPESLFAAPLHEQALYETVKVYLANQRQGTVKTKQRAEVAFSTVKLYRQKGTGRARAGSAKSPVRVGGGTVFGPQPREYITRLNRKVRQLALRSALSDRAQQSAVYVVESPALDAPRTRQAAAMLAHMGLSGKTVLVVTRDDDPVLYRSFRNIAGVDVIPAYQLNAYRVLRSEALLFTEPALKRALEVFGS